jgi:hypothetical protein
VNRTDAETAQRLGAVGCGGELDGHG